MEISVIRPSSGSVGIFSVASANRRQLYSYREIGCDVGGRGFEIRRAGFGNTYHVNISNFHSCDCKGFTAYDRCKHVRSILALIQAGDV